MSLCPELSEAEKALRDSRIHTLKVNMYDGIIKAIIRTLSDTSALGPIVDRAYFIDRKEVIKEVLKEVNEFIEGSQVFENRPI